MVGILEGWTGQMVNDSVAATVYTFTFMHFTDTLFHAYQQDDSEDRRAFTDGYLYDEFVQTLLKSVAKDGPESKYKKLC